MNCPQCNQTNPPGATVCLSCGHPMPTSTSVPGTQAITTQYSGLSGNEMFCVGLLGYTPGSLLVGNSVFSMGVFGSLRSNIRTFVGGELAAFTNMIAQGRRLSLQRFEQEMATAAGSGASGVTSELIFHPGNVEFLTVGSTLNREGVQSGSFTTAADGQELFCQWDAGYAPISFVFGNVAYSIGFSRGLLGGIRQMAKGEIRQYSDIFNTTRNLALQRITQEAQQKGANCVIGIRTTIIPLGTQEVQEMVMIGTASYNEVLAEVAASVGGVATSDLTAEETWNIAKLGYAPIKLVLGTSVYSLGVVGGIRATLSNLMKGEIKSLTEMIYGAREESLKRVQAQAEEVGADDVLGIKTYIYNLGNGLIEFLAIGTAVKRIPGITTRSMLLPAQAIIPDKDTFINTADLVYGADLQNPHK
jgi:uncharacterized protein YbjQ (UPF0145 family)